MNKTIITFTLLFAISGCQAKDNTQVKESPYKGITNNIKHYQIQEEIENRILHYRVQNNGFEVLVENHYGRKSHQFEAYYITGSKNNCMLYVYYYNTLFKHGKINNIQCDAIYDMINISSTMISNDVEIYAQQCYDCYSAVYIYASTQRHKFRILLKDIRRVELLSDGCNNQFFENESLNNINMADKYIYKCLEYRVIGNSCDKSTIDYYERSFDNKELSKNKCELYRSVSNLYSLVRIK